MIAEMMSVVWVGILIGLEEYALEGRVSTGRFAGISLVNPVCSQGGRFLSLVIGGGSAVDPMTYLINTPHGPRFTIDAGCDGNHQFRLSPR